MPGTGSTAIFYFLGLTLSCKRVYGDIEAFKFTPHSKTELVQRLIVAVEQRKVSWPGPRGVFEQKDAKDTKDGRDWEVLTNEMRRYEYAIGPSGGITYSAPAGYHDDCVMALALANHRRWETEACGRMMRLEGSGIGGRRAGVMARRRARILAG